MTKEEMVKELKTILNTYETAIQAMGENEENAQIQLFMPLINFRTMISFLEEPHVIN